MFSFPGKTFWRALRRRLASGVTLLAYLLAAIGFPVPGTPASAPASEHACGQGSCGCSAEPAAGCCCCKLRTTAPSCCHTGKHNAKKATDGPSVRWVVGMSAQKCRGAATHWLSCGAALPIPAPLVWSPSWPFCHTLSVTHSTPFVWSSDPTDPPPRG
jgi:hypothetical protein